MFILTTTIKTLEELSADISHVELYKYNTVPLVWVLLWLTVLIHFYAWFAQVAADYIKKPAKMSLHAMHMNAHTDKGVLYKYQELELPRDKVH